MKRRLVLIVSGNLLNEHADTVIACLLTQKVKRFHGNLILEPDAENGLEKTSEVLTLQVMSLAKDRLKERIGAIAESEVAKVHQTLNDLLRY